MIIPFCFFKEINHIKLASLLHIRISPFYCFLKKCDRMIEEKIEINLPIFQFNIVIHLKTLNFIKASSFSEKVAFSYKNS